MTSEEEDDARYERNKSKMGPYDNPENGCPNCSRHRVMLSNDGKHRCEKCAWCIEDNKQDGEFWDHLH